MRIAPGVALGGPNVAIGAAGFPYTPTIVELDISWTAERSIVAPEPARLTARMWLPDSSPAHIPQLGQLAYVGLQGGNQGGESAVFVGLVDKIARDRRYAERYAEPAARLVPTGVPSSTLSQYGVVQGAGAVLVDDDAGTWTIATGPHDPLGTLTPAHVTITIPLADYAAPDTWLFTGDVPPTGLPTSETSPPGYPWEPFIPSTGGNPRASQLFWRANGEYRSVALGPLAIGSTVPSDLALVARMPHDSTRTLSAPVTRSTALTAAGLYPPGEWVTVTASDHLATAARHRVGDTPWPTESVADRLARLVALSEGVGGPGFRLSDELDDLLAIAAGSVHVVARDVDSQPLGQLYAETLAAIGAVPIAAHDGLWAKRPTGQPRALLPSGEVGVSLTAVELPASVIPETHTSTSSTDLTNRIRITYSDVQDPLVDPVERYYEISDPESIARWGESSAQWSTPIAHRPGSTLTASHTLGPILDRLSNALPALADPAYVFDQPVTLTPGILQRLGAEVAFDLSVKCLSIIDRHGAMLYIPGTPEQLDGDTFVILSGSIVFDGARGALAITLGVESAGRSGAPSLTWAEVASNLADLSWDMLDPDLTWERTRYLETSI